MEWTWAETGSTYRGPGMGGTCILLPAGAIHRQRPEGATGKRPAYLDSSPEEPLPKQAWVGKERNARGHSP